jgi:dihydrofolate synthase/folylpolyglutamate synthase
MAERAYHRMLVHLAEAQALGVWFGPERVREALDRLCRPDARFKSVQIAGTNGKGSTAAMAEAILRAGGLRTGLFTSPHLARFTERIRLDGEESDGDRLAAAFDRVRATGVTLSYFESATVMALLAMAEAHVDVAVLETGLGGRCDAVTAVEPVATAITSIGLDHTDLLGDTLGQIAREKAGIARPGVPLYLGPLPAEAEQEIVAVAATVGAPIWPVGTYDTTEDGCVVDRMALAGEHQKTNARLAVALAREAAKACGRTLSVEAVREGLCGVKWPGRLEWVAPDVLLDGAHNVDGARALVAALPPGPRALVVSLVKGKDAAGFFQVLGGYFDLVCATRSQNERALSPSRLVEYVQPGPEVHAHADPVAALAEARACVAASGGGTVVVAGSLFLVGELRAHLLAIPRDPVMTGDPLP